MRVTLDLEKDVLATAREIARQQGIPLGQVVSELARQALARQVTATTRQGLPLFPIQPKAGPVPLELVNQLRDEG